MEKKKIAWFFGWSVGVASAAAQGTVSPLLTEAESWIQVEVVRSTAGLFAELTRAEANPGEVPIASAAAPVVRDDTGAALLKMEGFTAGRGFVVRDEGNFLRYIASVNADLTWERAAATSTDGVTVFRTASNSFTFEVATEAMEASFSWESSSLPGQGFDPEVILTKEGSLIPLYQTPPATGDPWPGQGRTLMLEPGIYTLETGFSSEDSARTISQDFALMLTVGEEPDDVPLPPAGDYTHPDIKAPREGDGILEIESPVILTETPQGDGRTELRLTASVHNTAATPWPEVVLEVTATEPGQPEIEVIALPPAFALAPGETAEIPGEIVLQVADADVAAVRTALLAGARFHLSGQHQPVFAYPVRPLTGADFEDRPSTSPGVDSIVSFPYAPAISSGTVWIEWEPFYKEDWVVVIGEPVGINPPTIARIQGRDRQMPVMVKDVTRAGTSFQLSFFDPENPSLPGATPIPLTKVMKEGQMVSELTFEGHPEGIGVTEDPETRYTSNGLSLAGLFPAPIPFHFNRFELSPGIELSGSFGFRPEDLVVNLEMENFAIKAFEVTARYRADCNLLVETSAAVDNSAEPIAGREGTLLDLQLFEINLSNGFGFAPRLVLEAGALVTAPTSLSVPVTAGLDVMVMAGVRDGVPVYASDFTEIPLQVSDPGLYEALGATVEAFIDCEIKALFTAAGSSVQSGPTLGARAAANFAVTPLNDPWWSANAEFSTFAGVEFNFFGILTIFDAEQTLESWPLSPFFPLEAEGPLFPPLATRSFEPQPGFQALGNPRTRWSRTLLPDPIGHTQGTSFALPLEGGDLLTGSADMIARLSPEGELVWAFETNNQLPAGFAAAEPDGGFTVLSAIRNNARLARFDAAGNVQWTRSVSGGSGVVWFRTADLVRRESATGAPEYCVLGEVAGGSTGGFHAGVVKLDADGNVLWSKLYRVPPLADEGVGYTAGALGLTASGDLLVVGSTPANLEGAGLIGNITSNGLVFKVEGETGEVIWSTLVAEADGVTYSAVSEGPDGSIYVGGNSLQGVTSENPSMLLLKLKADGSLIDSVLIGCAESSDAVPHGGESVYDRIKDMVWVDGQLWVCGQIGLFNAGSVGGVAEGASAFTAMISPELDVSRFVIHAGPATDTFDQIAATPDGLFVSGYSGSFHPWPLGASDEGQSTPGAHLAMMLPWEGRMRFHEASAGRQLPPDALSPNRGSYFVTPRVRATSQFTAETNQSLFPGLSQDNLTLSASDSRLIVAEDYTATANTFALTPIFFEPAAFKSLEFIPESLITDLTSYKDWWQLEGGEDSDGDGLTTEMEFFLGTSALQPEFGLVEFDLLIDAATGDPFVRFTLPRSNLAAPALPDVLSGTDLETYDPRSDVTAYDEPLDAHRQRLFLELPAEQDTEFLRLAFPE